MMEQVTIHPGNVTGRIRIPSSKSLCHRAIICAALGSGRSSIGNITMSQDIEATLQAMAQMGAHYEWQEDRLLIDGIGGASLEGRKLDVFCNESGSTLRFLIPAAAILGAETTFTGAGRLPERPLTTYYEIMEAHGFRYQRPEAQHLPLKILSPWQSGIYEAAGNISSQFITGLLMALPLAEGDSTIYITTDLESRPYVDLTLDMMERFGVHVINEDYKVFRIQGSQVYQARSYDVEGDFSQAAFFLVAGAIAAGTEGLTLDGMNPESVQGDKAILDILEQNRIPYQWTSDGGLRIIRMEHGHNAVMDASQCPDLVPIVSVLGAACEGVMDIIKAERLRIKESDRLKAVSQLISGIGGVIEERPDGLTITGQAQACYPGGHADSVNDHRIAMSAAVLALITQEGIHLTGADSVRKSWPDFWKDFEKIGGKISYE